jgi:hypothetical protein
MTRRADALSDIARRALNRRDYRVSAESDPDLVWLRGDRNRFSPLGTLTEHLAVLIMLAGVVLSLILGWREAFVIESGGTVDVGHATGITLRNDGFKIERYGDGSPAAYTAQVTLERGGKTGRSQIGVNQPAVERGTSLYLQGYSPDESRYTVTLLAVHDPGYGVIVGGGVLFLAGLVVACISPEFCIFGSHAAGSFAWQDGPTLAPTILTGNSPSCRPSCAKSRNNGKASQPARAQSRCSKAHLIWSPPATSSNGSPWRSTPSP